MADDDLIRRGDALKICHDLVFTSDAYRAIAALPAQGVRVKPLQFADERGDGVLTSRETGELFRIFPQEKGGFCAPKLPDPDCYAADAQTLIDRLNARWQARILAALSPAEAGGVEPCADYPNCPPNQTCDRCAGRAPDAVEAMVKAAAQDARGVFDGYGSKAREAIDYMEQVALAAIREGRG